MFHFWAAENIFLVSMVKLICSCFSAASNFLTCKNFFQAWWGAIFLGGSKFLKYNFQARCAAVFAYTMQHLLWHIRKWEANTSAWEHLPHQHAITSEFNWFIFPPYFRNNLSSLHWLTQWELIKCNCSRTGLPGFHWSSQYAYLKRLVSLFADVVSDGRRMCMTCMKPCFT